MTFFKQSTFALIYVSLLISLFKYICSDVHSNDKCKQDSEQTSANPEDLLKFLDNYHLDLTLKCTDKKTLVDRVLDPDTPLVDNSLAVKFNGKKVRAYRSNVYSIPLNKDYSSDPEYEFLKLYVTKVSPGCTYSSVTQLMSYTMKQMAYENSEGFEIVFPWLVTQKESLNTVCSELNNSWSLDEETWKKKLHQKKLTRVILEAPFYFIFVNERLRKEIFRVLIPSNDLTNYRELQRFFWKLMNRDRLDAYRNAKLRDTIQAFTSSKHIFESYRRLSEFPFASFGADMLYLSFVNPVVIGKEIEKRYDVSSVFFTPEYVHRMEAYLSSIQFEFQRSILVKINRPSLNSMLKENQNLKTNNVSLFFNEEEFKLGFQPYNLNATHLSKVYQMSAGLSLLNFVRLHLEWKYEAIRFLFNSHSTEEVKGDTLNQFISEADLKKLRPPSGLHFYQVMEGFATYEDELLQAVFLPLSKKMKSVYACLVSYKNQKKDSPPPLFPFHVLPKLTSERLEWTRVIFPAFRSLRYGYYGTVATSLGNVATISGHLLSYDGQYGAYLLDLLVNGKGDEPSFLHSPETIPDEYKTMVFSAPFHFALIENFTKAVLMQMYISVDQYSHLVDFNVY